MEEDIVKPGYIRVSSILKPLTDFTGISPDVLENARYRGEVIHKAIEMDSQGLSYPLPALYRKHFKSYLAWLDITEYRIEVAEKRLYDEKLKVTGKFDALVSGATGNLYLVDWKNTATANKEYWELQGTFYHHLASLHGYVLEDKIMFIQLCPEGSLPRVHCFERSEVLWRQCLKLYNQYIAIHPFPQNPG